ncbi:hypothetical protein EV363DRAFT_1156862 [Boletus edulis]|nr:hypothetical protein EV363DRAFT_1156862 [Boletus edulis]
MSGFENNTTTVSRKLGIHSCDPVRNLCVCLDAQRQWPRVCSLLLSSEPLSINLTSSVGVACVLFSALVSRARFTA